MKQLARAAGLWCLVGAPVQADTIKTDIVFVLDTSSSVASSAPNFASGLGAMASQLSQLGADARFGLVTFNNSNISPHVALDITDDVGALAARLNDTTQLLTDTNSCTLNLCPEAFLARRASGGGEDGFSAIATALNAVERYQYLNDTVFEYRQLYSEIIARTPLDMDQRPVAASAVLGIPDGQTFTDRPGYDEILAAMSDADRAALQAQQNVQPITRLTPINWFESLGPQPAELSYRDDAIKNIVVISDEPSQHSGFTLMKNGRNVSDVWDIIDLAKAEGALINAIGLAPAPSIFNTPTFEYAILANETGGNLFDIAQLDPASGDIGDFVSIFAQTKFQELLDVCQADPDNPACDLNSDASVVPLPAAGWLLLAGVSGLICLRRRA